MGFRLRFSRENQSIEQPFQFFFLERPTQLLSQGVEVGKVAGIRTFAKADTFN